MWLPTHQVISKSPINGLQDMHGHTQLRIVDQKSEISKTPVDYRCLCHALGVLVRLPRFSSGVRSRE